MSVQFADVVNASQHACRSGQPRPYDTLEEVIGTRGTPGHGSLREWGVDYQELALTEQGTIDWDGLATAITPRTTASPVKCSVYLTSAFSNLVPCFYET